MRHVSLSVLTTWGSDHRRRERAPAAQQAGRNTKINNCLQTPAQILLTQLYWHKLFRFKNNTLREVKHSDVIMRLFTEHSSAVTESQINRTTASKKSDSCSDCLPCPSTS